MEQFAVVVPYFNEAAYIADTLASLLAQTHPISQLILVDNGSTDGSEHVCRRALDNCRIPQVLYLREPRPGVIHALEHGARHVRTEFVAFADADTYYPPHYLATCARLFRRGRCAGVMAKDIYAPHDSWACLATRWLFTVLSKILPWHCFAGGAGQTFRTAAFRAAGGYSSAGWNYVLQDHEIINRLHKLGPTVYHPDHWCAPSTRRGDRTSVSWTTSEQTLYFLTPSFAHDWLFHRFLARRFAERQMDQLKLREQFWRTTAPATEGRAAA
ncbi:MAG TPA: glycosyltransferase family A protein [Pirellulales bacterium]|jgi:glycosyltransferase involved in cell wall biosynthesis|nr:glycosyltransferase family A protein [Pirellulales bacterium]